MDWTPRRDAVDETAFDAGRVGPYRLGRRVRSTALGEVNIAITEEFEEVVALERCHLIASKNPGEVPFLGEIAHVVGLRHRHLIPVIGAGVDGDVPYVVRPHALGATLADTLETTSALDIDTSAAILRAVLEVLAFLAEEGARPGVCAAGGFDSEDVMLGYDGAVALTNVGFRAIRCPDGDPLRADLASALVLAEQLDPTGTLSAHFASDRSAFDVSNEVRRAHRDACGRRGELVGGLLRRHFDAQLHHDRRFFGLATLH